MTENSLMIPYGVTDFALIRRDGYYYVDKTRFIPKLEREGNFVFFLRPRRFGKSLMLNMLYVYYDINYADEFDTLFSGLDIYKNPTPRHNKYLILKFNFSAIDPDKDKVQDEFNAKVLQTLHTFVRTYQQYLPEGTLEGLEKMKSSNQALNYVFDNVKFAKQRIYLLIDEYDNFANTMMAENEDNYMDLTHGDGFFRLFFNILKEATTNPDAAVERMFITGVTPLTLSDVTSGFNIGDNLSIDPNYNEMIGFTEDEVRAMLEHYRDAEGTFKHSVDELVEVMKPWYNNNCFSRGAIRGQKMFNSDMTLYFVKHYIRWSGELPEDMIDNNVRTDYNKVRKMVKIDKTFGDRGGVMQHIFEYRSISSSLKSEFSLHELQDSQNLPSMLFYMGLLTFGENHKGRPCLVIPNQVVYEQYFRYMEACYQRYLSWHTDTSTINRLGEDLVYDGDAKPMLEYICQQITTDSSNRDFDPHAEAFVKGFLLAKLGGTNNAYLITTTEPEENHGYSDLYMEPWNGECQHSFLIELKYCKHNSPDSEVEAKRLEAHAQLAKYVADKGLQQKADGMGWTLHKYAIVFRGWDCMVCEESK